MQAAQQTSLGDLGVRWYYWLGPIVFAGMGFLLLLAPTSGLSSKYEHHVGASISIAIAISGFLWPLLRRGEKMAPKVRTLRFAAGDHTGVFIATSKIQSGLWFALGTMIGICGLGAWIWSDDLANRIEGAAAFVLYVIFASMWLYKTSKSEPGIMLTKEGVLWHEPLLSPLLIPWESITAWYIYEHKDTPSSISEPSLGVRLTEAELEKMSKSDRHEVKENLGKFEAHLYYQAETLLAPLAALERIGNYYRLHPEAREELTGEAALARLNGGAVDNPAIQPV